MANFDEILGSRDRFVPANPEAEQAVLGSLLIDPDAILSIGDWLRADDFYQEKHGWIYQAILDLHSAGGQPADFVTATDELDRRKQLDEVGGAAYVTDLINAVPTAIHVEHYAKIVERTAILRRLIRSAGQIAQIAFEDTSEDVDAIIDKVLRVVDEATERAGSKRERTLTEVLDETVAQARENARLREDGKAVSIPFGLRELDRRTGGMWPSDVIVLAAPPGFGKSALGINIAHKAAKAGFRGGVFSLEMQDTQIGERVLSPESGFTAMQIRSGDIADWEVLDIAKERAATDNLYIDDVSSLTVAQLTSRIRRMHLRHGIHFAMIDYVQLLQAGVRTENRTAEMIYIAKSLKAIAKELKIVIIAIAQMNREYGKRKNKRPVMTDLDGSSQWEKEASVVGFIFHDDEQLVSENQARTAEIILAKVRVGEKGDFKIGWHPQLMYFADSPLDMTEAEKLAYRLNLMKRCEAMRLGWRDWKLHPTMSPEEIVGRARSVYRRLEAREKDLVTRLAQAMTNGGHEVDELALIEIGDILYRKTQDVPRDKRTPEQVALIDLANAAQRLNVLQQVQRDVVPALVAGRSVIFHGHSGRGKTLLARILQSVIIQQHGIPVVWLNWRRFVREIKATYGPGKGTEADVWTQTGAPILIIDDPDKMQASEWNVGALYDLLDERMQLSNGGDRKALLMVLNLMPDEFAAKLYAEFGDLGEATVQRAVVRSHPVVLDFSPLAIWKPEELA